MNIPRTKARIKEVSVCVRFRVRAIRFLACVLLLMLGLVVPSSAQYSPLSVPWGRWVWLKGDANVVHGLVGSTDAIQYWTDPNVLSFSQQTTSARPTYVPSLRNSYPGGEFTTDKFMSVIGAPSNSSSSDSHVFVVANGSGEGPFISTGETDGWNIRLTASTYDFIYWNSAEVPFAAGRSKLSGWHIFEVRRDGMSVQLGIDGDLPAAQTLSTFAPSSTNITKLGNRRAVYFTEGIAEVFVYERLLTGAERTSIFDYLTDKYNIPYRVSPAPVVQITAPANKASAPQRQNLTVSASVTDLSGTGIQKVEFRADGVLLGTDTSAPYSVVYNPPAVGTYLLWARAYTNGGSSIDSPRIQISAYNVAPVIASQPSSLTTAEPTLPLSVTASDDRPLSELTYTWQDISNSGLPAMTFSPNGNNAAKDTVATFSRAGRYYARVVVLDSNGASVTSNEVEIVVQQKPVSITVTPATASVDRWMKRQFAVNSIDQFGYPVVTTPTLDWAISGGGTISSHGLFTAGGTVGGPWTVTATFDPSAQYPPLTGSSTSGTAEVSITSQGADADFDEDGLSDEAESVTHLTNPTLRDTDFDGLPDGWEVANGYNPLVKDSGALLPSGLTVLQDYRRQVILVGTDGNQDGLLKSIAQSIGISDTNADPDGDGLTNADEILRGTNLYRPDTDGDTVDDYADLFPLDPARSALVPTPGDIVPPEIVIFSPFGATLN